MTAGSPAFLLQPNLVLPGTILKLTPEILHRHELQGLILDVDDTLVPPWNAEVSLEVLEWLAEIKREVDLWLVSNNLNYRRISRIAEAMNLPYLLGAGKPSRRKIRQAALAMNLPFAQVGMVGDRLFTDVLAGNRLGLFTILVEPILDPADIARSAPLRSFEIWVSEKLGATLTAAE
uniref:HAD superfamily (Subfamily IIIA) phosphatase, TIGR01668 n=1 Tax=Cyanothece sp. (strain PCC 7425 / ATCC 29141) TaxID=395961 RepID=B8HY71_CYAP4